MSESAKARLNRLLTDDVIERATGLKLDRDMTVEAGIDGMIATIRVRDAGSGEDLTGPVVINLDEVAS